MKIISEIYISPKAAAKILKTAPPGSYIYERATEALKASEKASDE